MLSKLLENKIVRFLLVGTFNTLFDLTILNTLVIAGHLPAVVANLFSASISISVSYFLNHRFVFRNKEPYSLRRFVSFFCVTGFGILAIQSLIIFLITHGLASHHAGVATFKMHVPVIRKLSVKVFELNIAKLLAVAVSLVWNFALYHLVIFKNHEESVDATLPL